ncbi:hypothetical protein SAMN06295967_101155 [Belliella buryatensis]|uniref:Uncharacterized protein n=1 Tax=Belliella buryatensis TaxID=1500549 RepID=A0A239AJ32_9BACT|nr:hypothetical protein SAMN06295967_101155 [Belliella buryatensis]
MLRPEIVLQLFFKNYKKSLIYRKNGFYLHFSLNSGGGGKLIFKRLF